MRITHLLIRRNEVIHIITFIRYATLKVLKGDLVSRTLETEYCVELRRNEPEKSKLVRLISLGIRE